MAMSDEPAMAVQSFWTVRPDPTNEMPAPLRKFLVWVAGVVLGGGGVTMWLIARQVSNPELGLLGASFVAVGLGCSCVFGFLGWFVPRVAELNEHKKARRAINHAAVWAAVSPDHAAGTPEHLAELALSDDLEVRWMVARCVKTPAGTLEMLASDRHRNIRKAVAINPATSEELLLKLVRSGDMVLCEMILSYFGSELPDSVRDEILRAVPEGPARDRRLKVRTCRS